MPRRGSRPPGRPGSARTGRAEREGRSPCADALHRRVFMAVAPPMGALRGGEVIPDGPPEAVTRDRRVVEAYLGQAYYPEGGWRPPRYVAVRPAGGSPGGASGGVQG